MILKLNIMKSIKKFQYLLGLIIIFILSAHINNVQSQDPNKTLQGLIEKSDIIVKGKLTHKSSNWNNDHRGKHIYSNHKIKINEILKGTPTDSIINIELMGGTVNDTNEMLIPCITFSNEEEFILFYKQNPFRFIDLNYSKIHVANNIVDFFNTQYIIDEFTKCIEGYVKQPEIEIHLPNFRVNKAQPIISGIENIQEINYSQTDNSGPTIDGINPSEASAGTNTTVTINGSNFGDTQLLCLGNVEFTKKTDNYNTIEWVQANDIKLWSSSKIICTVPISASSGDLKVSTIYGSAKKPFEVTFGYANCKWPGLSPNIHFKINPNTNDCDGEEIAIQAASNSWNAAGSNFIFTYDGTTPTTGGNNHLNELYWGFPLLFPWNDYIAHTDLWKDANNHIIECDVIFNDYKAWGINPSSSLINDVQTYALHEFGHWLMLTDLYGVLQKDGTKTMYGEPLGKDIILHNDGIKGINWIYPKPLSLIITAGNAMVPFCSGSSIPSTILYANGLGGIPPYTISWPGGTLPVNASGVYACTVTDSKGTILTKNLNILFIPVTCAIDPNSILGPEGFAEKRWISVNDKLTYTINFENDPEFATAPAQVVRIKVPISDKANMYSTRIGDFGFGNFTFSVPPNISYYTERLDLRDSLGIYLDVMAGLDVNTREVFWNFITIDPATGLPPNDPTMGFLPVNDSLTHRGEGYVTLTFRPDENDITGDSIQSFAEIKFDINDPLNTNNWVNSIDAFPPSSTVDSLPPVIDSTTINITFTGQDDPGGCGISKYQLWFSKDNGPFEQFGEYTAGSAAQFTGIPFSTYGFFSRAVDHVGNTEPMKTNPDVTTTLGNLQKNLHLTVFLEALYTDNSTMNQAMDENGPHFGPGIADKVIVELHNVTNYSSIEYSSGLVALSTTGNINISIPGGLNGSYYITIKHRSSIETTTAQPVSFAGIAISYDFSNASSKAFGDNMANRNGVFVIYAGDASQDGLVDASDMLLIEAETNNFTTGYVQADVNCDGLVDASDMLIVEQNTNLFISSVLP
jgi:hypothetical protein